MVFKRILGDEFLTQQTLVESSSVLVLPHTSPLHNFLCREMIRIYFSLSNFVLQKLRLFNIDISFIVQNVRLEIFSYKMCLSEVFVHVACGPHTFLTYFAGKWINLQVD